ncbi:MAG: hypothetical protein COA50_10380 [Flavobacteriaceae bacterium]|nr:MAG: hypothetical protein COA50_10380 [Flavobacteriaceae bacterium]
MSKARLIFFALFILMSCSKDEVKKEDPIAAPNPEPIDTEAALLTFNTAVRALGNFENPEIVDPPEEISADPAVESGNYVCVTKRFKAAPEFNEMLLLNPNSQELYPGALIKGESIVTGEYKAIGGNRSPITLSVSLTNLNGPVSAVVENPANISEVRQGISDILRAGVTGSTPAEFNFSIESVYSEEQLSASIGANYSGATIDASGSFDFSSQNTESKIVVKFVQRYFSVDIDTPETPGDLFTDTDLPDPASFGATLPNIVSSVNYGRMVLFVATSSYSNIEMEAAFKATYDSAISEGGVEVEANYQRIMENSSIKAFVLGGDGDEAVKAVSGVAGVKSFILSGGNYSEQSPGAPLSYTLKNINDFTRSNVVLSTEYTARVCQKVRSNYRITLTEIDCSEGINNEGDQQMYGYIYLNVGNPDLDGVIFPCFPFGTSLGAFWGNYDDDDYQTASANKISVGTSIDVTLPIDGDDYLYLSGHLYEYDTSAFDPDEDLGSSCKKLYIDDLTQPIYELNFNGDGDKAMAIFTILPID